jgi:hypothetical protein
LLAKSAREASVGWAAHDARNGLAAELRALRRLSVARLAESKNKKKMKRRTLPEVPIVSAGKRSAQQMNYNWGVMSDSLRVEIY